MTTTLDEALSGPGDLVSVGDSPSSRWSSPRDSRRDPLAKIRSLDSGARWTTPVAALLALVAHSALASGTLVVNLPLARFVSDTRQYVAASLQQTIDLPEPEPEPEKPPEPEPEKAPEPEPEPEKAPEPEPAPTPLAEAPPTEAPPPAAPETAQAGQVLTDPDAPLDLTGDGFVLGSSDRYSGGTTSARGTSKKPVTSPLAREGGTPGGTGSGPAVAPAPREDKSRPARPASTGWNSCGFPPEADVEQIDYARVTLVVTVGADGRPTNVVVVSDPGYGFGGWARSCAFRRSFEAARDPSGQPVASTTAPFTVTFTR